MGFEYNFKITEQDIESLAMNSDSIDNLDKLLRTAPCFIEKYKSTYTYSDEPENENRWPLTISVREYGFSLCIYNRSPGSLDWKLMNYLIFELLNRCGHVEVEDA